MLRLSAYTKLGPGRLSHNVLLLSCKAHGELRSSFEGSGLLSGNKKHLRRHLVGGYLQKNPSVFLCSCTTFHDVLSNRLSRGDDPNIGYPWRLSSRGRCDRKSAAVGSHYASNSPCLQQVRRSRPMAYATHGSYFENTAQDKASR